MNLDFFKLSPRQKLQKVLSYLFLIIAAPFAILADIDFAFNSDITEGIRYLCVWHGINWFDWTFRIVMAIAILASVYDFAKQIESKKAKMICTAIYLLNNNYGSLTHYVQIFPRRSTV